MLSRAGRQGRTRTIHAEEHQTPKAALAAFRAKACKRALDRAAEVRFEHVIVLIARGARETPHGHGTSRMHEHVDAAKVLLHASNRGRTAAPLRKIGLDRQRIDPE